MDSNADLCFVFFIVRRNKLLNKHSIDHDITVMLNPNDTGGYNNMNYCQLTYEQFSLQPAHPCLKIDHVGFMFPVYMVITSENEKIIWKVVFKILTYFANIRALFRHLFGRNADIWSANKKITHPIHWNGTKLTYIKFLLAITKTPYDSRQYQSHRGIRESEKYVPNVHDNDRNIWRAWSRTCMWWIQTLANDVLIKYNHAKNTLVV